MKERLPGEIYYFIINNLNNLVLPGRSKRPLINKKERNTLRYPERSETKCPYFRFYIFMYFKGFYFHHIESKEGKRRQVRATSQIFILALWYQIGLKDLLAFQ